MKVKELINKSHLYPPQEITVIDHSQREKAYKTLGRYDFELPNETVKYIHNLKVNSFEVGSFGLRIHAE